VRAHAVGKAGKGGAVALFGAADAVVLDADEVVASGVDAISQRIGRRRPRGYGSILSR
jgi:hypothetical protein